MNVNTVKGFCDNIFQHGTIPLINKPTRVTNKTATLIDNIFTNYILNDDFKKGIIKYDISDHFAVFVAISISENKSNNHKTKFTKREFTDRNKQSFKTNILKCR